MVIFTFSNFNPIKKMRNSLIALLLFTAILNTGIIAQDYTTVSESRKANLKKVIDYRYKGGFYTLEKDFNKSVKFPDVARLNCRIGICIASLFVDCKGVVQKVSIKNPLKLGIDEEVTNFFSSTAGKWNTCDDERYTKFDIPIQFTLTGTETNTTDAMLICVGEGEPGQPCNSDEYYIEKVEKLLEKKKGKKAMQYIDILIRRNPYTNEYYEMKKEAITYLKK